MGNDKNVRKTPTKLVALITYIVALAGLLLGLLLPFTGSGENILDNMLLMQLPAAINGIYPLGIEFGAKEFAFSYVLAKWGEFSLDMGAILAILYALVTVAGVVALIPVIAGSFGKKSHVPASKSVAVKAAAFIEVCAAAVLASLLFMALNYALTYGGGIEAFNCYTVMGAFGGVFLMLVVQAVFYKRKRGSGVGKTLLALLGIVTALVAVFDIKLIIPQLADMINGLKQDWLGVGLAGDSAAIDFVNVVLLPGFTLPEDAKAATITLTGAILAYIVLVNCVLDIMGLGKRTNRPMLIANVARYALEIAAVAVIIIVSAITEGVSIGLFAIVIAALALIAFVINIIRLVTYKPLKKTENVTEAVTETAEGEEAPKEETRKERKAREKAEKLAAKEAKKAEKDAKKADAVVEEEAEQPAAAPIPSVYSNDEEGNVVYTPVIYNGPTDDFIRTLSNDQKLEFSRIFLERQASALTCIPDYNVGGKNDKFFASVFIYYSKVRDLVSDGLMNEIYKQANMMK